MEYRAAREADAGPLAEVYYRAVHEGAAEAYSKEQRAAWAPSIPSAEAWRHRLEGLSTIVAEEGGQIVGFMSLNPHDGDLDLAFVLPEVRGTGVAKALYAVLEDQARTQGLDRLHTHASHVARPFFEGQGWTVLAENTVERQGVALTNWIMEKRLT